jgi:hypothetical protein
MNRISSLTVNGTEPLTEKTVPQVHKSIVDYLVSSHPHPLCIDLIEYHHSLTTTCFEIIQGLTFNVGHITTSHRHNKISSISQVITYPCGLDATSGERATQVPDVEKFMKTHSLQWLEVLSLQKARSWWIQSLFLR